MEGQKKWHSGVILKEKLCLILNCTMGQIGLLCLYMTIMQNVGIVLIKKNYITKNEVFSIFK
jgi:hypothetical protein